ARLIAGPQLEAGGAHAGRSDVGEHALSPASDHRLAIRRHDERRRPLRSRLDDAQAGVGLRRVRREEIAATAVALGEASAFAHSSSAARACRMACTRSSGTPAGTSSASSRRALLTAVADWYVCM